jgi:hemolysin D
MKSAQPLSGPSADRLDFLPEMLRLQERPPSPFPRAVLRVLLALIAVTLLWAFFGKLDVTAVAAGKIVPQSYLKIVQPVDGGIIRDLLVKEGDAVKAGQVLVRMDRTLSSADMTTMENELGMRRLQLRRIDAELGGTPIATQHGESPDQFARIAAQYQARRQAYLDAVEAEQAVLLKARHDLKAAMEVHAKLERTVPIYKDQAEGWDKLAREGYAGRLLALDRQRSYIESEQDLRTQAHTIEGLKASIAQSEKRAGQITSNYRQQLHNEKVEAEGMLRRQEQDHEKLSHRHRLLELKAPHDGTVKDLATHTTGSVIAPGTIVMTLVPHDDPVQAEVWLDNHDAGFIEARQPVKIKVLAYPFQKYGMIDGAVLRVSPDATDGTESGKPSGPRSDAPPGSYRTLIALKTSAFESGGAQYRLAPGMKVNAEIHLGTRSIMEYLLSPVKKIVYEAGRER